MREDENWRIQQRAVIQHTEWSLTADIHSFSNVEVPEKLKTFNTHYVKNFVQSQSHLFTVNWDIIIRNDISLSESIKKTY